MSYDGQDNVRDVTCSDKRLVEEQSHPVNRGNLFPKKIPIDLQDVSFRLSGYFPVVRTQSHLHPRTDNERKANFSRLEIDFIKLVLKTLNLKISNILQTADNRSDGDFYVELANEGVLKRKRYSCWRLATGPHGHCIRGTNNPII